MNGVLGQLLPLAIVVMVSPLPIIGQILLLFTAQPKANAAAYAVGFTVAVVAVLGLCTALASTQDLSSGSDSSRAAAGVRIVLGVLLMLAAVRRLRNRKAADAPATMPKWMAGIASSRPPRALVLGLALGALNPKLIAMAIAGGIAIAGAGLSTGEGAIAIAFFTVISVLGVAAPLVVAVALGDRAEPVLRSWREWLTRNNSAVMAVVFLVIGAVLLGKGIEAW